MKGSKYVTLMLIPDGAEERLGYRMRSWVLKTIVSVIIILVVGILLFFIFYGKVLSLATQADKLSKENERLMKYHYKVQLLEKNLNEARSIVTRLTELAGIDITFPEMPEDSVLFADLDRRNQAVIPRSPSDDWSIPAGLPIQGFISQAFKSDSGSHQHPGIDIPCAENTPVLATAAGRVIAASYDSTYGEMVVLRHNDSTKTVYAHNKEILVKIGQNVLAGSRIAMSGNTGISSAPHLHYEIRINDNPINPLEFPDE